MGRKAEIIAVGTELLLGQIVNTNAQFLAQQLADLGVNVFYQTVVGDNSDRLQSAIQIAQSRADIIVFTGGLGPTQDDLTRDAVAAFCGRSLVMHDSSLASIKSFFDTRGVVMVESNARQALMVEQADPLINDVGMAVGCAFKQDQTMFILLPGPPREMKPMFTNYAAPWIRSAIGESLPLFSTMLKFSGIGESNLEHQIIDLIDRQSEVSIAPYAKEGEVAIRLAVKASNMDEANRMMQPIVAEIHNRFPENLFSTLGETLEATVVRLLSEKKKTVAVAESITGGRIGDLITSIPGSSKVFLGGFMTYSNTMKNSVLNVPMTLLEGEHAPGAISKIVVETMAIEARKIVNSNYAIAICGNAGPDSAENKPVGLTFIAVADETGVILSRELQLHGNRDTIKQRAAKQALYALWTQIGMN